MPYHPTPREPAPTSPHHLPAVAGGTCLAFVAGYIDGVFYRIGGVPVTHVTGSAAKLAGDSVTGDTADAVRLVSVILAFVLGAAISGVIVGTPSLRTGRRYGIALIVESVLLSASAIALPASPIAGAMLAAAGAGLQNAMASTYMGLIVRTTHITGITTDIGFMLGQLAHRRIRPLHLALLVLLLSGFVSGATAGSFAAAGIGPLSIWPAAIFVGLAGAGYLAWRLRSRTTKPAGPDPDGPIEN